MRNVLSFLVPARIGGQIAVLVLTALVLAHGVMAAAFFLLNPELPRVRPEIGAIERLVLLAGMLDAQASPGARAALLNTAAKVDPGLTVLRDVPPAVSDAPYARMLADLAAGAGGHAKLFIARAPSAGARQPPLMVVARLSDGAALAVPLMPPPPRPLISPLVVGTLVFLAIAVAVLSLWAARQLTAPLVRLADAAERFSTDAGNAPLAESGPLEVRRAAKALNDMQQRVSKLIADRTRMLAAVSHDLRTPITRLRLRAEYIENPELRAQFLRDLASMQNLVQSALSFLRGQVEPARKMKTDLPALVQTVCDDFSETGGAVSYSGPAHLYVTCEPEQLMRAIENLVDNGLKFGKSVAVRVEERQDRAIVDVQDDGPGITAAEKARATEPFYRGDSARNLDASDSFGLGLSIAQAIVARNGGTLELLDGAPQGLLVRIALPVASGGAAELRRPSEAVGA